MNNRWRERLNELLKEKNTPHNTTTTLRERVGEFSGNVQTPTAKTAKTQVEGQNFPADPRNPTAKTAETQTEAQNFSESVQTPTAKTAETPSEAEHLGLVAAWSRVFGYLSIHDPTSGEWYDVATNDAPDWAKREAFKRKELYRDGNRKAYRLTAREMEDIWEAERIEMWTHPAVTDHGIVYEDYLEEEE